MISLDTETTGKDWAHGSMPYFVTTCDEKGDVTYWEWDVDPLTRKVNVDPDDREEIRGVVGSADRLVLQNSKFDVTALAHIEIADGDWPWEKTEDTLIAGHLLASNQPHDLTSMVLHYLGVDVSPYEDALEEVVKKCRRLVSAARAQHRRGGKLDPGKLRIARWAIAEEGRYDMPSVKSGKDEDRAWKADGWLPKAMIREWDGADKLGEYLGEDVSAWETVLAAYANADSESTIILWKKLVRLVQERGLEAIYRERMKVVRVAYDMERHGISLSGDRLEQLVSSYSRDSEKAGRLMSAIAADIGHELQLPANGVNKNLSDFCLNKLKLEPVYNPKAKTDAPTLNKAALEHYLVTLEPNSPGLVFIKNLTRKRNLDTAVQYMNGYRKFWVQVSPGWYMLYPSLNPTGTNTLRWSCVNPNEQNISKKEGYNLRYCFGPMPGREWWSLDAKNIELRLPAYESGEEEFIALFERPDDPPYYGSNHLLIAHILHKELFEACRGADGRVDGRIFKKRYESTWYKKVKNGNFAVLYGAMDRPDGWGTADRAYGIRGAHSQIKKRLSKMEALNQKWIKYANKHGYVETIPDKSVDPSRGYPIMCGRTQWGGVSPTLPLNYHIQGTAMWWMQKAMVRCHDYLILTAKNGGPDGRIVMQVHDELVFDLPAVYGRPKANLPYVRELRRLMEQGGEDIGIPTPVSIEYHKDNWAEGITCT